MTCIYSCSMFPTQQTICSADYRVYLKSGWKSVKPILSSGVKCDIDLRLRSGLAFALILLPMDKKMRLRADPITNPTETYPKMTAFPN